MSTFVPIMLADSRVNTNGHSHDSTDIRPITPPNVVRQLAKERGAAIAIRVRNLSALHDIAIWMGVQFEPGFGGPPLAMSSNYFNSSPVVEKEKTEVFVLPVQNAWIWAHWTNEVAEPDQQPGYRIEWGLVI